MAFYAERILFLFYFSKLIALHFKIKHARFDYQKWQNQLNQDQRNQIIWDGTKKEKTFILTCLGAPWGPLPQSSYEKITSKPINTSSITEIKSVKHWETPQAKQQLSLLSGEINFTQHHINCHHTVVLRSATEVVHKESRIGLSLNDMTDALVNMNTMQSLYSNLIWSLKIKHSSVLRLVWAETWLPPDTHHMLLYSHHVVWPW